MSNNIKDVLLNLNKEVSRFHEMKAGILRRESVPKDPKTNAGRVNEESTK